MPDRYVSGSPAGRTARRRPFGGSQNELGVPQVYVSGKSLSDTSIRYNGFSHGFRPKVSNTTGGLRMADWTDAVKAAMKVLGTKGKIPDFPKTISSTGDALEIPGRSIDIYRRH